MMCVNTLLLTTYVIVRMSMHSWGMMGEVSKNAALKLSIKMAHKKSWVENGMRVDFKVIMSIKFF